MSSGRARPDEPLETWCEARTTKCTGRSTIRHHRQGRRPVRDHDTGELVDVDDKEHTLDICAPCHDYIHAHPAESYERGWMIRRVT